MKNKWKNILIVVVIVGILSIPIVYDHYSNKKVNVIDYNQYGDLVMGTEHGETTLVYYGDPSSSEYETIAGQIVDIQKEYKIDVVFLDYTKLTDEEKIYLLESRDLDDSESGWIVIKNQTTQYINDGSMSDTSLDRMVNKYHNGVIPASEVAYTVAKDATEYRKVLNSKDIVMTVFGRTTCSWCRDFKPIYNELAAERELDIYVFDYDTYNETEYQKVMDFGLEIPAACTQTGSPENLADGFGTPLTLFTQGGKVIDCISGYLPREGLISKLESVGML